MPLPVLLPRTRHWWECSASVGLDPVASRIGSWLRVHCSLTRHIGSAWPPLSAAVWYCLTDGPRVMNYEGSNELRRSTAVCWGQQRFMSPGHVLGDILLWSVILNMNILIIIIIIIIIILLTFTTQLRVLASSFLRFRDHTLDEGSACRRDLYLTNTQHSQQTSMPPAGFEPAISAGERLQTDALNRLATGIGERTFTSRNMLYFLPSSMKIYLLYIKKCSYMFRPWLYVGYHQVIQYIKTFRIIVTCKVRKFTWHFYFLTLLSCLSFLFAAE